MTKRVIVGLVKAEQIGYLKQLRPVEIPADPEGRFLSALQQLVGGPIETVNRFHDVKIDLFCNEEGKLLELPSNFYLPEMDDTVAGDVVFVKYDGEDMVDTMTEQDLEYCVRWLERSTQLVPPPQ